MKRTLQTAGVFLASVLATHLIGILMLSILTPFTISQMTHSYAYSFVSMFISLLVAAVIAAEFDDKYKHPGQH
jgi:biotin transporter BioY